MSSGTPGFIGKRLKEAREEKGMTQTKLADRLDVSKESVSKIEKGDKTPSSTTLDKIIDVFQYPIDFFFHHPLERENAPIFYRSFTSASNVERKRLETRQYWYKEILNFFLEHLNLPQVNFPQFPYLKTVESISNVDMEEITRQCREHWELGEAPISDLTNLMERNGAVIVSGEAESKKLDAHSIWTNEGCPFIFLATDKNSVSRTRFNIAHELGHLVLHRNLNLNEVNLKEQLKELEGQANLFASLFLLPGKSFYSDFVKYKPPGPLSLNTFISLKIRWKVSIKSMIYRCKSLDLIQEGEDKRLYMYYNSRRWGKGEPGEDKIGTEDPKILKTCVTTLLDNSILTKKDIINGLKQFPPSLIGQLTGMGEEFFEEKEKGPVVQLKSKPNIAL